MDTIDLDQLLTLIDRAVAPRLVMTHETHRHAQAHIPGSQTFEEYTEQAVVDPDEPIVLYCSGDLCGATHTAYRQLRHRGHRNVQVLRGGLTAWAGADLPLAGTLYEQHVAVPA